MTYDTAIAELFVRAPRLEEAYRARMPYLLDEPPLPYVFFGSILIPALEDALRTHDLGMILRICAYLEDASVDSKNDLDLMNLIRVEFGEWLDFAAREELLAPWLGAETKRICGYVPGLATQRLNDKADVENTIPSRIKAFFKWR